MPNFDKFLFIVCMSFLPYEEFPRPGACPTKLKPPSGVWAFDTDECRLIDWDSGEETKKCCSNNCFEECVQPAVRVAIRGEYIIFNDLILRLLIVCFYPSAGPNSARDFVPFRLTALGPSRMSICLGMIDCLDN